jgi:hypothetical protein
MKEGHEIWNWNVRSLYRAGSLMWVMGWIELVQDRERRLALVKAVMNLQIT